MAGARAPADIEGMDLRALMLGRADDRGPVRACEDDLRALVSWPNKLMVDDHLGTIELFDLAHDPAERDNVADERPDVVEQLRAELDAFDQ
jgi:hypothetical protein